ncbi:MAG: hypothetical protein JNL24_07010 [Bacteroidia bacterium]|nr:hypothetical protein [Bacteroidia bacterium]
MIKNYLFIALFLFGSLGAFSQKKDAKKAEPAAANTNLDQAAQLILKGLNKYRVENGLDTLEYNETLAQAADIQAQDMAKNNKASLVNSKGKYETTQKRVVAVGGTKNAEEIVFAASAVKGKAAATPQEIADATLTKWKMDKKALLIIKNGNYIFGSPKLALEPNGKKAYVSMVFGSYNSFNTGADKKKELKVPYTSKNKKIKAPDNRVCKNCEKFKDYEGLVNGIYEKDGKIYMEYDNLKAFLKLIKKPTDGLAIDVVQRAQYEKENYNIIDYNLLSKGKLLKTMTKDKILSKNLIKPEKKGKKVTKLDVELGKLPKGIVGDYELNLLIIQDGKVCKTVMKSYLEQGDQESNSPLSMLYMPEDDAYNKPPFEPKSESTLLTFTVPFEKNKSDYKDTDVQPFLDAMQEPDFFIEGLYITAYSSIEGDAAANAKLQKKRAESIIKAMAKYQKPGVVTNVKTSDSWSLFQMETEDGKYDYLSKMTKEKAIKEINSKGLAEELEPILSKERFAQIVMDVTYDITGPKEEKFSVSKFNQAVKKADMKQAYKIQYFIGKQLAAKKYTADAPAKMNIPMEAKYSGLLNNQVVNSYKMKNNNADDEDYAQMKKLATLDPSNSYITFNNLFCAVKLDSAIGDKKAQGEMQGRIDALYKSNIPKKYVDALNTEWQFRIIETYDTVDGAESIIEACINKVKSFYNIKESSWQNNLKLAYVFARFKDYKYATNLLAPFIKQEKPQEAVLFAYISFCSQVPELIKSRLFVEALQKAEKANHDRYCKLFGKPYLTFQVFDNPNVKADYNKAKCK